MRDAKRKITKVLCSSGEDGIRVEPGQTLQDVLDAAAHMLDGAYLNNVVVVSTRGKHFVGDFSFEFREVTEKEALRVAKDFGPEGPFVRFEFVKANPAALCATQVLASRIDDLRGEGEEHPAEVAFEERTGLGRSCIVRFDEDELVDEDGKKWEGV